MSEKIVARMSGLAVVVNRLVLLTEGWHDDYKCEIS
jgi:hypothetical protein